MLINEVEHIVGLSKKSIRYYESNGLLTPKRIALNIILDKIAPIIFFVLLVFPCSFLSLFSYILSYLAQIPLIITRYGLMKTSHLGLSAPKSLTLCTLSGCRSLC